MLGSGFIPDRIGFANVGAPSGPGRIALMNVGCGAAATGGAGGRGLFASATAAHPPPSHATPTTSATHRWFTRSIVVHPDAPSKHRTARGATGLCARPRRRSVVQRVDHLAHLLRGRGHHFSQQAVL